MSRLKKNLLTEITKNYLRSDLPSLQVGEEIKVTAKVNNEEKAKLFTFKGIIIKCKNPKQISYNFTLLDKDIKRIIFYHSPLIKSIEKIGQKKVRRANLSYLLKKG